MQSRIDCKNLQCLTVKLSDRDSRDYNFDKIANQMTSQEDMFRGCGINNLLDAAVSGYACTIFAYGQTGAGKTYRSGLVILGPIITKVPDFCHKFRFC